ADGAAVQQIPGYAVGIDRPVAENTGIEEEEPAIARPADLGIELGHQHRLAMVNGNLRRPHLNLERHHFASSNLSASRVRQAVDRPWTGRGLAVDWPARRPWPMHVPRPVAHGVATSAVLSREPRWATGFCLNPRNNDPVQTAVRARRLVHAIPWAYELSIGSAWDVCQ